MDACDIASKVALSVYSTNKCTWSHASSDVCIVSYKVLMYNQIFYRYVCSAYLCTTHFYVYSI